MGGRGGREWGAGVVGQGVGGQAMVEHAHLTPGPIPVNPLPPRAWAAPPASSTKTSLNPASTLVASTAANTATAPNRAASRPDPGTAQKL